MEKFCRRVLFCDVEPVLRTVAERYSFVMWSKCGELLQEGIICDRETVWRIVARWYGFVVLRQCGELLQLDNVF